MVEASTISGKKIVVDMESDTQVNGEFEAIARKEIERIYSEERNYFAGAVVDGYAIEKRWLKKEDIAEAIHDGVLYALGKAKEFDPAKGRVKAWAYKQVKWGANAQARRLESRLCLDDGVTAVQGKDGTSVNIFDIVSDKSKDEHDHDIGIANKFGFNVDPSMFMTEEEDKLMDFSHRATTITHRNIPARCLDIIDSVGEKMRALFLAVDKNLAVDIRVKGEKVITNARITKAHVKTGMIVVNWRRVRRVIPIGEIQSVMIPVWGEEEGVYADV